MKSFTKINAKTFFWVLLSILIVVLILLFGVAVGIKMFYHNDNSPYYAVYLDTGDLYFGQISNDDHMTTLSNAWYIQRDQNNNSSLVKFTDIVWGPTGNLSLNKNKIVWISKISNDSKLLDVFSGKTPINSANNKVGNAQSNENSTSSQIIK